MNYSKFHSTNIGRCARCLVPLILEGEGSIDCAVCRTNNMLSGKRSRSTFTESSPESSCFICGSSFPADTIQEHIPICHAASIGNGGSISLVKKRRSITNIPPVRKPVVHISHASSATNAASRTGRRLIKELGAINRSSYHSSTISSDKSQMVDESEMDDDSPLPSPSHLSDRAPPTPILPLIHLLDIQALSFVDNDIFNWELLIRLDASTCYKLLVSFPPTYPLKAPTILLSTLFALSCPSIDCSWSSNDTNTLPRSLPPSVCSPPLSFFDSQPFSTGSLNSQSTFTKIELGTQLWKPNFTMDTILNELIGMVKDSYQNQKAQTQQSA